MKAGLSAETSINILKLRKKNEENRRKGRRKRWTGRRENRGKDETKTEKDKKKEELIKIRRKENCRTARSTDGPTDEWAD